MTNCSPMDFAEWSWTARTMIESRSSAPNVTDVFNDYVSQIVSYGQLSAPNVGEMPCFLNEFSTEVIPLILNARGLSEKMENAFANFLSGYSRLAGVLLLSQEYERFVTSALKILTSRGAPFFALRLNGGENASHNVCVQRFLASNCLRKMRETWTDKTPIEDVQRVSTWLAPFMDKFPEPEVTLWIQFLLNLAIAKVEAGPLRNINAKAYDSVFALLVTMTGARTSAVTVREAYLNMCIQFVRSGVLSKQICGMNTLVRLINEVPDGPRIISENGIMDFLLQSDMHQELAGSLSDLMRAMLRRDMVTDKHIALFWEMTVSQRQSVIDMFVKGLNNVVKGIPHESFVEIIIEANYFPQQALNIVRIMARAWEDDVKRCMFNTIWKLYFDEIGDATSARKNELVETLNGLFPTRDAEFCDKMQKQCMDMIEQNENIDLAVAILERSFSNLSPERANTFFDIIVQRLDENSVEYLDLVVYILRKRGGPMSEDRFRSLMKHVDMMIRCHTGNVCAFIAKVIDNHCVSVPLLSNDMILDVFRLFCSLDSYNSKLWEFVLSLYNRLNDEWNGFAHIELIWSILFRTGNSDVQRYLYNRYTMSRENKAIELYVEQCFRALDSVGSLKALAHIIKGLEDGIDRPRNMFRFVEDFFAVSFIGSMDATIAMPPDISFKGFVRTVALKYGVNEDALEFRIGEEKIHARNFKTHFCNGVTFFAYALMYDNGMPRARQVKEVPSVILSCEKFTQPLSDILYGDDAEKAALALEILNWLPSLESELLTMTAPLNSDWFCVKSPFRLVYRIHMLANRIAQDEEFAATIGGDGMTAMINAIANNAHDIFRDNMCMVVFVFRAANWILSAPCCHGLKSDVIGTTVSNIPELMSGIVAYIQTGHDAAVKEMIEFLRLYECNAMESRDFSEVVKATIFHRNGDLRASICNVIRMMPYNEIRWNLMVDNLPKSTKAMCAEFFSLMDDLAERDSNTERLWEVLTNCVYENFRMPESDNVILSLMFRPPKEVFTCCLFRALMLLIKRLDDIPDIDRLFDFMTLHIVFNDMKYYGSTTELFTFYLSLIDKKPSLVRAIIPRLKAVYDATEGAEMKRELSSTTVNRGIVNLGATCYVNSTLQQLFNIPQFRREILKSSPGDSEWFREFRYVFAKLALFPAAHIDISSFIETWKGYDGEIVNPRVQQDSVEFLQLLLERLEDVAPHVTDIFKGAIKHVSMEIGQGSSEGAADTESFVTFPLEVKDMGTTTKSFKSFLEPETFDSTRDGKRVKMTRYDRIETAPRVFIVQLKRFAYDVEKNQRKKINSSFRFETVLDLAEVVDTSSEPLLYDLCGVVLHMGSAQAGHYFSYVRREGGDWLCMNDTRVSRSNASDVCASSMGGCEMMRVYDPNARCEIMERVERNTSGYLLFYAKRETCNEERYTPEVSQDLTERLVSEIKQRITQNMASSDAFSLLIAKVAAYDDDGVFVFPRLVATFRATGVTKATVNDIVLRTVALCNENKEFASFIIKQQGAFNEFLIMSSKDKVRMAYSRIVIAAIDQSTDQEKREFSARLVELMGSTSDLLLRYIDCFQAFFNVFSHVCVMKQYHDASGEVTQHLVAFICERIPVFEANHSQKNMMSVIDLSSLLTVLVDMADDDASSRVIGAGIFTPHVLKQLGSPCNIDMLMTLITKLVTVGENVDQLMHLLSVSTPLPIPLIVCIFVSALLSDIEPLHKHIFVMMSKKKEAQTSLFLMNLSERIQPAIVPFSKIIDVWIVRFMLSDEQTERSAMKSVIVQLFNEDQQASAEPLRVIVQILVAQLHGMSGQAKRNSGQYMGLRRVLPFDTVLDTLSYIAGKTKWTEEFGTIAQTCLTLYLDGTGKQKGDIIMFLKVVFGEKLFDVVPLRKFALLVSKKSTEINMMLMTIVPASKANEFVDCEIFSNICAYEISYVTANFIWKHVNDANVKRICEMIWTERLFRRAVQTFSRAYFRVSWRLLRRFPVMADILEKSKIAESMWSTVCSNIHVVQRRILASLAAKVLAAYNSAYAIVNKDKKSWFKKRTLSLVEFYERNGFRMDVMTGWATKSQTKDDNNDNFISFLISMCCLDRKCVPQLLRCLAKYPNIITAVHPAKMAARLVCWLAEDKGGEEEQVMLFREFQAISTQLPAVNEFCRAFLRLDNPDSIAMIALQLEDILMDATDPDVLGTNVEAVVVKCFDSEKAMRVRNRVSGWVIDLLRGVSSLTPTKVELVAIGKRLENALRFLYMATYHYGFDGPSIPVAVGEDAHALIVHFQESPETERYADILKTLVV